MHHYLALIILLALLGCGSKTGPNMDAILADRPAPTLSDYGLFTDMATHKPRTGVTPYDLINPLFTDYAAKERFVFIPPGASARYRPDGAFSFPVGTVLIKSFGYNDRTIETRLLIHKQTGWTAYPYVWNEAQTSAVYAPAGARQHLATQGPNGQTLDFIYVVPNANQCKTCHQSGHDITPIGPSARSLNHNDQLEAWENAGLLTGLPVKIPTIPNAFDEAAAINERARAYLDINCAHCHKRDGSASNTGLWLNWSETMPVRIGIHKRPTAAGRGSGGFKYVIEPGDAAHSIMAFRVGSPAPGIAMPELGRALTHTEGAALIDDWINAMPPL